MSGATAKRTRGRRDLQRANWALQAYLRSSLALTRNTDFSALAGEVCEAIVADDVYRLAIVGLIEPDQTQSVRIVATAGSAAGYADGLALAGSETHPGGAGPTGEAIRTGRPLIVEDARTEALFAPWRARARRFRIRSSVTTPFSLDGRPVGVLLVYAARPHAFGPDELAVFQRLGDEMALAMSIAEDRNRRDLAEAEYRRLFEYAPDAVVIAQEGLGVIDVNSAFTRLTGLSREEVVGSRAVHLLDPAIQAQEQEATERMIRGEIFEAETTIRTANGETRRAEIIAAATPDRRMMMFLRDVTDRRRAESLLRDTQTHLARMSRISTLGEMAATIAHEINQPLAAIITNGEAGLRWLTRPEPVLSEVEASLRRMIQGSQRAGDIIQRIRRMMTRGSTDPANFDLKAAIEEAVAILDGEPRRLGVAILIDVARDLPSAHGDRVQTQQVLLNLTLNAVEALKGAGTSDGVVWITAQVGQTGELIVAVRDNGPGFGGRQASELFEPYFTTRADGTGLGLSLCRSIVETQGGAIHAREVAGGGAEFVFTLPQSKPDLAGETG